MLQCGLGPKTEEISRAASRPWSSPSFNVASVRRPRKSDEKLLAVIADHSASMWPRSEDRGNSTGASGTTAQFSLQCGLGPKTEEIAMPGGNAGSTGRLQCGLGPKTEEIVVPEPLNGSRTICFNVASVRRPRKFHESINLFLETHCASMWPRSEDRGNLQNT